MRRLGRELELLGSDAGMYQGMWLGYRQVLDWGGGQVVEIPKRMNKEQFSQGFQC